MLRRTHLALGVAIALYFLPHIKEGQLTFLGLTILASILPDMETGFSTIKKHHPTHHHSIFHRPHILHTYTFLFPITIIVAFYYPMIALPLFLGYSFHLFLDSFSPNGIRPFWPLKQHSHGKIAPGGRIDRMLFIIFLSLDVLLLFSFIMYG
ncbi:MAG: metal-dependent hydrolase [archaeon]